MSTAISLTLLVTFAFASSHHARHTFPAIIVINVTLLLNYEPSIVYQTKSLSDCSPSLLKVCSLAFIFRVVLSSELLCQGSRETFGVWNRFGSHTVSALAYRDLHCQL